MWCDGHGGRGVMRWSWGRGVGHGGRGVGHGGRGGGTCRYEHGAIPYIITFM